MVSNETSTLLYLINPVYVQRMLKQRLNTATSKEEFLCKLMSMSGCWNRGVPLYTEVSSFQGVGIGEFHCIQRCPHFRVLE